MTVTVVKDVDVEALVVVEREVEELEVVDVEVVVVVATGWLKAPVTKAIPMPAATRTNVTANPMVFAPIILSTSIL